MRQLWHWLGVFMSSDKPYVIPEKPLSNDELNERMFKMLRDRARQAAEFRKKYNPKGHTGCTGSNAVNGQTWTVGNGQYSGSVLKK
jgi:hypothetical protein